MKVEELIKRIVLLPSEFKRIENNKSIYSLLKDTQYFVLYDKITESNIHQELNNYTEYVDHWLRWSENKRRNGGWYFLKEGNNKFVVGYMGSHGRTEEYKEFNNAVDACASYIKKEIESIRLS